MLSKTYKLILERGKEGVLQSDLWKLLNLTSRDGSRLAIKLEKSGMVKRERVVKDGRRTYRLRVVKRPIGIGSIYNAPCVTCPHMSKCSVDSEVSPHTCPWIKIWVLREYRHRLGTGK